MEFMLDSANLKEIKQVKELGLLDGLTTNPIIIKRGIQEMGYQGDFLDYAKRILELTSEKPVFFQVVSPLKENILLNAEQLYQTLKGYGNVHIKVPINTSLNEGDSIYEGLKALIELKKRKIPTLATAIVTPMQAFLASRIGADYAVLMLRPYDNIIAERLKLEDLGEEGYLDNKKVLMELEKNKQRLDTYLSGIDILERASKIFRSGDLETKLIIAGIRNPLQASSVLERRGVSAMTLPYKVFTSLFSHEGTRRFVRDTYAAGNEESVYGRFLKNGK